jgi:methyltransferase (TIGR00027 family)
MRENKPSTTAQLVTLLRDLLSDPRFGLVEDPYANRLLRRDLRALSGAARGPWMRPVVLASDRLAAGLVGMLGARTRFFDERIQATLAAGVTQVVLLGAGYDARPYRLSAPGARFFEIDHPATQHDKRSRLGGLPQPNPVTYVSVDFTRDNLSQKLAEAGHDSTKPSFFLWEGVVMYLNETAIRATLGALRERGAPGSRLAFDFTGETLSPVDRAWAKLGAFTFGLFGEPVRFWCDPARWGEILHDEGWSLREVLDASEIHARYLRGSGLSVPRPMNFLAYAERSERSEPANSSPASA